MITTRRILSMANNPNEAPGDDFFEQILGIQSFGSAESGLTAAAEAGLAATAAAAAPMMLQLGSGDASGHISALGGGVSGGFHGQVFPLGLSLDQGKGGFLKPEEASGSGKRFRDDLVDGSRPSTVKNVRVSFSLFSLFPFNFSVFKFNLRLVDWSGILVYCI